MAQSEIYRREWLEFIVGFRIISNARSAAFPMLALVGNARDSVL